MWRGIRYLIVALCAIGSLLAAPASATAAEPIPDWTKPHKSLLQAPGDIVAQVTKGIPLRILVTRKTAAGPEFESIPAATVAAAKQVVAAVQKQPDVIAVEMASRWSTALSNDSYRSQQWALSRFRAESVWQYAQGKGLVVAVVDTGVHPYHPDLARRVLKGHDFANGRYSQTDDNGHGTHVAGIIAAVMGNGKGIAGLAPNARILPVKVLDSSGSGWTDDIAKGIRWATDRGAKVINLSLEGPASQAVNIAIQRARSKNILVVAAAGNQGCEKDLLGNPTTPTAYPAAYTGVVGVAAVDANLNIANFSSCGSWVDVSAPGVDILSTMPTAAVPPDGCGAAYCEASGTSMAAPYVSAQAILIMQAKGYKGDILAARIRKTTGNLGPAGWDNRYGYGFVNPLWSVK